MILGFAAAALTACTSDVPWEVPEAKTNEDTERIWAQHGTIHGQEGILAFGTGDKDQTDGAVYGGIGVNAYLWRASLETIDFMPLAQADPFGGVIITDWYTAPEKADERFKVNIFILDKQLRSDGVKVKVFRQVQKGGKWIDSTVADNTGPQMEDAILTRARQLRVADLGEE